MTMTGDETLTVPQVFRHPALLENEPVQASDLALARRAAGGDARAFEEIYRIYRRLVYGLCMRMTQNVAESEDIT